MGASIQAATQAAAASSDDSKCENETESQSTTRKISFHLNEPATDNDDEEDEDEKLDVNFEVRPEKLTSNSNESFADDVLANTANIRKNESKASLAEDRDAETAAIEGLL